MEFILNTIFWTLALYGLFEIIKNIIYINSKFFIIPFKNEKSLPLLK